MSRTFLVTVLVLASSTLTAACQEPAPAIPATPDPPAPAAGVSQEPSATAPAIPEADIESLAKSYADLRDIETRPAPNDVKGRDKLTGDKKRASEAFLAQVQKVREELKGADALALVDSWSRIFSRAASLKKQMKPEGLGRLHDDKSFKVTSDGKELGFKYAYYVPQSYDAKKAWPVIVCLHDKTSTGPRYLNEVWLKNNDPAFKEMRDKFIFVAPTIEERTLGKKEDQVRIEFFDRWFVYAITRSLIEVVSAFNVDMNRIYVDGCGQGGQAAMQLAIFWPKIAAVAARTAEPRSQRYLGNLKNQSSLILVNRRDGIFSTDQGKTTRDQILQLKESYGLDLEFKDYDPLPNDNLRKQAIGSQVYDPVHDASAEILTWFSTKSRNANPPGFFFVSNNSRRFRRAVWAVIDKADADPDRGSECFLDAKIDRKENVISVRTANVEAFRLYINDKIVDMDRAIKVVVDGVEVKEMKVDRSLQYLLDYQRENANDPSAVMTGEIKIVVPTAEEAPAEPPKDGEKKEGEKK